MPGKGDAAFPSVQSPVSPTPTDDTPVSQPLAHSTASKQLPSRLRRGLHGQALVREAVEDIDEAHCSNL